MSMPSQAAEASAALKSFDELRLHRQFCNVNGCAHTRQRRLAARLRLAWRIVRAGRKSPP
jgi:hypothetical protein